MKASKPKKIISIIFVLSVVFFLFSCGGNSEGYDEEKEDWGQSAIQQDCTAAVCGNEICEQCEDIILLTDPVQFKCAKDCPGACGDGVCNPWFENADNCPQDCTE